jgi:hypothetical protein
MDSEVLRITRNHNEVPVDFPFLFQGNFVQVHADFEESGGLRELTIEDPLRPWAIDFTRGDDPALGVTRIIQGEEVFWGVIQNAPAGDIETWYDRDGNPLMVFTYLFRLDGRGLLQTNSGGETPEEYYQDSFGNTSRINSLRGVFSAGYTMEGRPRYWERQVPADSDGEEPVPPEVYQFYTFQWDEGGFLVRLTGTPGPGEEDPVDFRYDYTLDEKGNWIERQEIRMIPRFGMLVPSPGSRIIRKIEYEPED